MTNEENLRYIQLTEKRWMEFNRKNPGPELSPDERDELFRLGQLHRQRLREQYGALFPWLCELLYRYDPVRLAGCEAPKDEYQSEAYLILPELDRLLSENSTEPDAVREVVYRAFEQMFNRSPDDPDRYHPTCGYITDKVYADIALEISVFMQDGWVKQISQKSPQT